MWPLYCQLKVLPLDILIQIEQAKTMYKFEYKMLPQVFDKYFQKPTHQYNTRYASTQNNFQLVRISSAKETSLLQYYGPKVWASIPLQVIFQNANLVSGHHLIEVNVGMSCQRLTKVGSQTLYETSRSYTP